MPLYDYECHRCGLRIIDVFFRSGEAPDIYSQCPNCCEPFAMLPPAPAVDAWSDGRHFEHLSPKGETFTSRKDYRNYLKDHHLREYN